VGPRAGLDAVAVPLENPTPVVYPLTILSDISWLICIYTTS